MLTCELLMLTCIYKLMYDYFYITNVDIHINVGAKICHYSFQTSYFWTNIMNKILGLIFHIYSLVKLLNLKTCFIFFVTVIQIATYFLTSQRLQIWQVRTLNWQGNIKTEKCKHITFLSFLPINLNSTHLYVTISVSH